MRRITSYTETPADAIIPGPNSSQSGRVVQVFSVSIASDNTVSAAGTVVLQDDTPPASAPEILTNGALTAGTGWAAAGDFTLDNNRAEYLDVTNTGTITQAAAGLAVALKANTRYAFTYTVSALVGEPVATITTGVLLTALELDLSEGTHTAYFQTKNVPGDFVISVTSTVDEAFNLDDLSITQAASNLIRFANAGTDDVGVVYTFDEPLRLKWGRGLRLVINAMDHVIVTLGWA